MDTDPDTHVRDIVIDTMAAAGYAPRSSANSRAYRRRVRDEAAPAPIVPTNAEPAVGEDEVECYTVREVAARIKLGETKTRALIAGGVIKSFSLYPGSDDRRVRKCDLAAYITSRLEDN